jgi:eukaryotic-like serine/threonine-protein kinase
VLAASPGESAVDTHETPVVPMPQPAAEVEDDATQSLPAAMMAAGSSVAEPPTAAMAVPMEPAPEPRRSVGRTVVVAVLTLLVLGGLLFGGYWLLAPDGERLVSVPSILESTREEAEAKLREAELRAAFLHKRGPDDATRGTVVAQSPAPDTEIEPGSTVTAEINVGPATTKIPGNLVGRDLDKALEELADAGFTNVTAVPIDNPPKRAEPDEVVAVDPAEGERAALEEDIVVNYVGRTTDGPTAGGAPATKDRPPAEKESEDEPDASEPAKKPTRSSAPDDDDTATSGAATRSSARDATATVSSAPASSADASDQESADTDPAEGEGGMPAPSVSGVPGAGVEIPGGGESLNP